MLIDARQVLEERRRFLRFMAGVSDPVAAVARPAEAPLSERERRELVEIEAALERLEAGTWGRCESCGRAIGRQRLRALPETRWCMDCASTQTAHP